MVAVGAADPFIGRRVDVQVRNVVNAYDLVDVRVSVDSQENFVSGRVE